MYGLNEALAAKRLTNATVRPELKAPRTAAILGATKEGAQRPGSGRSPTILKSGAIAGAGGVVPAPASAVAATSDNDNRAAAILTASTIEGYTGYRQSLLGGFGEISGLCGSAVSW